MQATYQTRVTDYAGLDRADGDAALTAYAQAELPCTVGATARPRPRPQRWLTTGLN